jgi:hypothetical protein
MRIRSFLLWFALLPAISIPAFGDSEPNVSLNDPVYAFLDRLDTLGIVDSYVAGMRPLSRDEVARLLCEAAKNAPLGGDRPALAARIRRFQKRFRWTVAARGGFGHPTQRYRSSLRGGPETDLRYIKPEVYLFPVSSLALKTALLDGICPPEGRDGLAVLRGGQVLASLSSHGRLASFLSFHVRPEVILGPDPDGKAAFSLLMRETYVKATVAGLELEVGFDDMTWGPGRHGAILLSRNTEPFPGFKFGTPSPFRLPWFFSHLGLFRFELFTARLERARVVPHALLGGLKVNWKPFPWVEFGASRVAVFGGDGRPSVGAKELWKIWWGIYDNVRVGEDLSNQLAGFDGRVRVVLGGVGLSLYGEAIGEDETNMFPYKWSTLAGLVVAGLPPFGLLDLRIEWTHTHRTAYRHGTYGSGYRYRGALLGHHVGTDGKDVYVEASFHPGDLTLTLFGDWEARREQGSFQVEEDHLQFGVRASLLWCGATISGAWRYRHVRNADYVRGRTREEHFLFMAISWTW